DYDRGSCRVIDSPTLRGGAPLRHPSKVKGQCRGFWPTSYPKAIGEFGESISHNVGRGVWRRVGWAGGTPFVGPADEGGSVPLAAGGVEIEIVARNHQDLARSYSKETGSALIGLRPRLVDAKHVAGNHGVPVYGIAARNTHDQRQAEDREGNAEIPSP